MEINPLHLPITIIMTKKMTLRISDTIATSFAGLDDVVIYQIPKVFIEPLNSKDI